MDKNLFGKSFVLFFITFVPFFIAFTVRYARIISLMGKPGAREARKHMRCLVEFT
jgi:hypothetical protein